MSLPLIPRDEYRCEAVSNPRRPTWDNPNPQPTSCPNLAKYRVDFGGRHHLCGVHGPVWERATDGGRCALATVWGWSWNA